MTFYEVDMGTDSNKLFRDFSPALFGLMETGYFDTGCSETVQRILYDIYINSPCTAASVARRLHISKSHISGIINEYEKEGYIRREEPENNGRILLLYLTDKGKSYIEMFMSDASSNVGKKIAALGEVDRQKLMEAFSTIMNILKQ